MLHRTGANGADSPLHTSTLTRESVARVNSDPRWTNCWSTVGNDLWMPSWSYRYDRFARSLRQLVNALEEFRSLGIDFISIHEGVDPSLAGRTRFRGYIRGHFDQ